MVNYKEIKTKNWQLKLNAFGGIVENFDDVDQCISIILKTPKGSIPHKPNFGCGVFNYLDSPANTGIPGMIMECYEALRMYESRINILKIVPNMLDASGSQWRIDIEWTPKNSAEFYKTEVYI